MRELAVDWVREYQGETGSGRNGDWSFVGRAIFVSGVRRSLRAGLRMRFGCGLLWLLRHAGCSE
jgi:hypothetical protein